MVTKAAFPALRTRVSDVRGCLVGSRASIVLIGEWSRPSVTAALIERYRAEMIGRRCAWAPLLGPGVGVALFRGAAGAVL